MAIISGRNGQVLYDSLPASPASPIAIASLKTWKLSLKTDYTDVTCFGDPNKVYVPNLRDISGSGDGFWNSGELTLIHATQATTPGVLRLVPSTVESSFYFEGPAYLDADLDCGLDVTKLTFSFKAASGWTTP